MYNLLSFIVLLICFNQSLSQSQSSDVFVKFMTPQKELVTNELTLPATIKPNEKVNITSTVSEKIEKIFFKEGVSVKKNEILVVLNHFAETAILKQFEAKLKEAETNLERALSLSKNGNISQSIVDNRVTERDSLLGKVEEIKAQINDLILRAPFDGIIGLRNFSEGAFIKPGDIISTIYDFSVLKVEASAPEIYSDKIKKGNNVKVKVNTYEESISGKVSVVDPFVDETTRTFKVISNIKKKKIKPGMMAKVTISIDDKVSYFIPESSIIPIDNQSYVYVINENNTIKKVEVIIGIRGKNKVEVLRGIKSNDKIVYEGVNKIKAGTKVRTK